jgi:D-3-phosphoglycerate dehydrogenase
VDQRLFHRESLKELSAMKRVLLDNPIHPQALATLEERVETLLMYQASLPELRQTLPQADAAIVSTRFPLTEKDIGLGTRLQVIGRPGAGVDSVDIAAATDAGVPVVYTPEGPTESVAEHTLCFMVMLAKQMLTADAAVRSGDFQFRTRVKGTELYGKTLGIIGGGHIGSRVASIGRSAFDMKVLVYDPYISAEQAHECGADLCATLDQLMADSDFVSIHCPLTPDTRGLVGTDELALMKPTAFLINTSRGPVVDESALIAALREGRIAGAALDVFEQEPPDPGLELLSMQDVVLTPHMASFTNEGRRRMGMGVVEQVLQVLRGERPRFLANPAVWDHRRIIAD